jgi:hypothetical protein
MEREPKTGRFLPGNQVAVGNKGNRKPKWGNKNAVKHGFFQSFIVPTIRDDGNLYLYKKGSGYVCIKPEGFIQDENGDIWLRDDVAARLDELGYGF